MKLTLLGTGSPVPMADRASSGYVIEIGDEVLVFDHGQGAHTNFLKSWLQSNGCKHSIFLAFAFPRSLR